MNDRNSDPLDFTEYPPDEMIMRSREFYEAMKTRRTVRDFAPRPIPEGVIGNALRTAGTAPSGANCQPWHFVAVMNPAVKRQIRIAAEQCEQKFYAEKAPEEWLNALNPLGTNSCKPFLEMAPCLIAIFAQRYSMDSNGNRQKAYYRSESVGIATGILIAALHTAGLATLTYTPTPMRFLNQILDRPDHERPHMILVTGYPAGDATVPAIERKSLDDIATFV